MQISRCQEDVVPEFGRENLLRVYEFIKWGLGDVRLPTWQVLQVREGDPRTA